MEPRASARGQLPASARGHISPTLLAPRSPALVLRQGELLPLENAQSDNKGHDTYTRQQQQRKNRGQKRCAVVDDATQAVVQGGQGQQADDGLHKFGKTL